MAFLDNSGDIILDAVLTDTGRLRLAKGDGSFKITQFAFGDDEINYSLYDKNHPSGSAYYDLDILQSPVFEAFTNNASSMKSLLLSNPNSQLLYLPSLVLTQLGSDTQAFYPNYNTFFITADSNTVSSFPTTVSLNGVETNTSNPIVVDQGINTTELANTSLVNDVEGSLVETNFIIELNNNLLTLCDANNNSLNSGVNSRLSFIDDDGIASYSVTTDDTLVVISLQARPSSGSDLESTSLVGPRDKRVKFKLKVKTDLQASTYLFTTYGGTDTVNSIPIYYIDTFVKVKGATTGTSITVPIRIIKNQN
jgi:hypothetical protein